MLKIMKIKIIKLQKKELEKNGLKVQMTTESSNNVKKIILFHKALKNTEVEEGSTVQFIVSKGKTSSKMKTKIQRNLNLLVKTSLMIHKS